MKKVSVVLPSYNYEQLVSAAIESVLAQTYGNWELVIVDDGSADRSPEIIQKYAERFPDQIKLFFHEDRRNKGLVETYKLALSHCSGDYVAFIEADDIWHRDSIAAKAEILNKFDDIVVVHNKVEMFGDDELVKFFRKEYHWKEFPNSETVNKSFYAFPYLVKFNFVLTFSSFMARSRDVKTLDFSVKHDAWFDWWFLVQLSVKGRFFYIPQELLKWRVHRRSYNITYNRSIDEYQEGLKFKEGILEYFKRHLETERAGGNKDDKRLVFLSHVVNEEERRRGSRHMYAMINGTIKKIFPKNQGKFTKDFFAAAKDSVKAVLPDFVLEGLKLVVRKAGRPRLIGNLDSPLIEGACVGSYQHFDGWFFASDGTRIVAVEIYHGAKYLGRFDYGFERNDVYQCYPHSKWARNSGFSGGIVMTENLLNPLTLVAWDEKGRWYKAFEHKIQLGSGGLQAPFLLAALFQKSCRKDWAKSITNRKILIAGLPKSGTSALFYKIKGSLPQNPRCLFEPRAYEYLPEDSRGGVLAKILLNRPEVNHASFAGFEKKVLIIRDPRDMLVSWILYSIWNAPFYDDNAKVTEFMNLLKKKERDPGSVSLQELLRFRKKLSGARSLERDLNRQRYFKNLEATLVFQSENKDSFVIKYEDFVDGRLKGLERFLGFKLASTMVEGIELERVGRTKSYGDWKNWFLEEDIEFFKPLFSDYMKRYGYKNDWRLNSLPKVLPQHSSEFVARVVKLRREEDVKRRAHENLKIAAQVDQS